jgi:hypothetical protein
VYCAIPLVVFVAIAAARAGGWQHAIRPVAFIVLGLALGGGLWFAKNAALTGNPTYPLLYQVLGGESRTPEKEAQWQQAHRPPNYQPADLIERAWDLAVAGAWLSPLVAPLGVLAWSVRSQRPLSLMLGGLVLFILAAWWLLTHRIDRFVVPIWPLAAMLAGVGATWCTNLGWRRALVGILAVGLVFNFVLIAGGPVGDNRYLVPLEQARAESVVLVDPWHAWLNDPANQVQRVLLVGDAQPFDLEVPAVYNTVFDDSIFAQLAEGKTPAEVRQTLIDRGVSHIYVSGRRLSGIVHPATTALPSFSNRQCLTVWWRPGCSNDCRC